MRMKKLIRLLRFIEIHGWLGFLTYFIPVYWKQDIDLQNNGYDIWSFKKLDGFYLKGKIQKRNTLFYR